MSDVTLHLGDNLETLKSLRDQGARFDLVELDGPYMAGLEGWDNLTEAEYIQHYAERLILVRDVLCIPGAWCSCSDTRKDAQR